METTYRKSERAGWRGETVFPLAAGVMPADPDQEKRPTAPVLLLTTYKGDGGKLVTSATCARKGIGENSGWTTTEIFGDYSRTIISEPARCTEKTVRAQHERAAAMISAAMEEAREFYRRKAAGVSYRERYAGLCAAGAMLGAREAKQPAQGDADAHASA